MLAATLAASLLRSTLAGKKLIRGIDAVARPDKVVIRPVQNFNDASSFN